MPFEEKGKRVLIWDNEASGHHLEYLNNLHSMAVADPRNTYFFAVRKEIENKANWSDADNLNCIFLPPAGGTFAKCRTMLGLVRKYKIDAIFFVQIMESIPLFFFLLFFVSRKTRIEGILYQIYLYRWKKESLFRKAKDALVYTLFKMGTNIDAVLALNDRASARVLNRVWKTDKFKYLTDPFYSDNLEPPDDYRKKYDIGEDAVVFLHCGSLAKRKGTLEILKAINKIDEDREKRAYCFVGKVKGDIAEEFNSLAEKAKKKHHVVVVDDFVPFKELCSFINTADHILLPYAHSGQSSGVIAYSAAYGTPVALPRSGLLKRLSTKYKLGSFFRDLSDEGIREFILQQKRTAKEPNVAYLSSHTVEEFLSTINGSFSRS